MLRLALLQLAVGASKAENVSRACSAIAEAAASRAQIVMLPVRAGAAGVRGASLPRGVSTAMQWC